MQDASSEMYTAKRNNAADSLHTTASVKQHVFHPYILSVQNQSIMSL